MDNRRNLYRLLHVQPDAPTEVIRGSYRTLMQTLRRHPDLGGDEWNAQLLNEARDILCDSRARADYDVVFKARNRRTGASADGARGGDRFGDQQHADHDRARGGTADASASADERAAAQARARAEVPPVEEPRCHYCRTRSPTGSAAGTGYALPHRCRRCGAPTRAPIPLSHGSYGEERRGLHRVTDRASITVTRHWPTNDRMTGTLLEFSTTGCAFEVDVVLTHRETVLLSTEVFTAVGAVCTGNRLPGHPGLRIGVEFLSVDLHAPPGAILTSSA